jgi:hypothetical protein
MLPARTADHELAAAARAALRWRRDAAWPGPAAAAGARAGAGAGHGAGPRAAARPGGRAAAAEVCCGEVLGAVVEVWHNAAAQM